MTFDSFARISSFRSAAESLCCIENIDKNGEIRYLLKIRGSNKIDICTLTARRCHAHKTYFSPLLHCTVHAHAGRGPLVTLVATCIWDGCKLLQGKLIMYTNGLCHILWCYCCWNKFSITRRSILGSDGCDSKWNALKWLMALRFRLENADWEFWTNLNRTNERTKIYHPG